MFTEAPHAPRLVVAGLTVAAPSTGALLVRTELIGYFDGMVDIVNRDEGTVNKYNGDNIPVLSSAPLVSFGFAMGYQ